MARAKRPELRAGKRHIEQLPVALGEIPLPLVAGSEVFRVDEQALRVARGPAGERARRARTRRCFYNHPMTGSPIELIAPDDYGGISARRDGEPSFTGVSGIGDAIMAAMTRGVDPHRPSASCGRAARGPSARRAPLDSGPLTD